MQFYQNYFSKIKINFWLFSSLLISSLICVPILIIFSSFFTELSGYYKLLTETYLYTYIINTVILFIGVILFSFVFGVGIAYLVSFYIFPGSKFITWAIILSFAVPGYIYAYSLTAFFEYFGNLYSLLSFLFGEADYNKYMPRVDSMFGSIISISFSLFVYVYLITRVCFIYQSQNQIDAGRNMGFNKYQIFSRILIPAARPGIIAGLSLVAMETISDFGTVSFFNVQTLTTAIYDSWIFYDDLNTAYQLSFFLILFVFIFFSIEKFSRSRSQYNIPNKGYKTVEKTTLKGKQAFIASFFCFIIFFLSFVFPVSQMLFWVLKFPASFNLNEILTLSFNTSFLVIITTSILIFLSFLTNYGMRVTNSKLLSTVTNFSISGYAIPGIILSVTILTFASLLSNFFGNSFFKIIIIGTVFGMVTAYCIRFYALAINGIKSGYEKLNKSIDDVSYLMGYTKFGTFIKVHLPFLKQNLVIIGMMVSIDILKELPITFILRPYNFDTFATKAYVFASQDMLEYAASPSLFLILFSSIFILLSRKFILKGF
ncbi:MAG: iron ABC transporter [Candidatus Pelagibacter sp.]|nr:iron ABC transporter [Candidatus Pelagibacter sp.]OUW11763.1 MAG: iron ABC transporter [Candidatus Pelagibacter sp. TMED166]|tara:strand:+ start:41239 stop:42867 length:1629 start_codon:yes stop_codon:yes gene_type:complete